MTVPASILRDGSPDRVTGEVPTGLVAQGVPGPAEGTHGRVLTVEARFEKSGRTDTGRATRPPRLG
jgi:hypothetical protein